MRGGYTSDEHFGPIAGGLRKLKRNLAKRLTGPSRHHRVRLPNGASQTAKQQLWRGTLREEGVLFTFALLQHDSRSHSLEGETHKARSSCNRRLA